MRKKLLTGLACGIIMMGANIQANAAIINGGFETNDFSGWSLTHDGSVVSSWEGDSGTATGTGTDTIYTAAEGTYFAVLKAGAGQDIYSILRQGVILSAGESLFGAAAFDYRDYAEYDDSAFVQIVDSLGNVLATPWSVSGLVLPDNWDGPWTNWTWTAISAGTYYVQYGVANWGDNVNNSAALFDIPETSAAPVPEPATMLLMGTGLAGLAGSRLRRKK